MKKTRMLLMIFFVINANHALADSVAISFSGKLLASSKCAPKANTTSVTLPDVYDTDFSGIGSTAGNKAFPLDLVCTGAITQIKSIVKVLSGSAGAYNSSTGVLNLDGTSTASGVGVQILFNNNPVQLNTAIDFSTITSSGNYSYTYFSARYMQTASSMTEGSVSTNATLEISYQ